ncbi:MAG: peptidylprolyl isomerase [Spirochaetes bacterium]|nr:peptidylprolyl isomerase [Spirochaetota bacterium]
MKTLKRCIFITLLLLSSLKAESYDRILAVVNEDIFTLFNLKDHYYRIRDGFSQMGKSAPRGLKSNIFDRLVNQKLIEQAAEKREIFISENEIDQALENIKVKNHLTDSGLKEELKKVGKTMDELREEYRNQILNEKIISIEVRSRVQDPTEEEIRNFYNKNQSQIYTPPRIRVKHILILDNPNASLDRREQFKQKAKSVLKKALSGVDFDKLAKQYSEDDSSAASGGDIGYIAQGEWLPEIDEILFKIKKGQVAGELLYSRLGWHIIKVVDKKGRKKLSLDEARFNIKNRLIAEKIDDQYKAWIEDQKTDSYIEVIIDDDEKYIYFNGKWKRKNGKQRLTNEELYTKIEKLNL